MLVFDEESFLISLLTLAPSILMSGIVAAVGAFVSGSKWFRCLTLRSDFEGLEDVPRSFRDSELLAEASGWNVAS